MKLERIIKEGDNQFWSGSAETVGKKLLELDPVPSPENQVQVTEKPLVDIGTTRREVLEENMSEVDNEVQMRKVNDDAAQGRRRGQQ